MKNRESILENIIYFSMIFSLVYIISLVIQLDMGFMLQAFFVVLGSIIVKFLIFNPIVILIFIVLSFFSMIFINRFFPIYISPFFERTTLLLTNIFHNLTGRESIAAENALLFWGIVVIFLASFTGIIIFKKKSSFLLLGVYLSFFLYYWYTYIDAAYWMMVFFLFLFFVLMTLKKYNLEVFEKDKLLIPNLKDIFPPWLWTGVIYAFIIIILALSLPKTTNVVKWPWLQGKFHDTFPKVENWRSSSSYTRKYGVASYFDFSLTGYENIPSRLGGPVNLGDEKIMTVYATSPQYLRGNIKHRYTGDYWEIIGSRFDDYNSGTDFSNLNKVQKKNYFETLNIRITYNSFSSKTIFAPYVPSIIHSKESTRLGVDRDYALMAKDGIYSGESYGVTAQVPLPYNKLMESNIGYYKTDIIDIDDYLQMPDEKITEATKMLTRDIVRGINSDLDKAMAMEEYLRNNYEYSLDVSIVPDDHEFIDYFLFHEKKGYCTYYATTLAIMLRLENIPSRYIEGYLAKELVDEGKYEVTQKNAHTWVEAFIEPIGWIQLEATPAYPISPRYNTSKEEDTLQDGENSNTFLPEREVLEEEGKRESQEDAVNGNTDAYETNDLEESKVDGGRNNLFIVFLWILFAILPLRLLFVFLKLKYRDFKMAKLSNRKKIIYLYDNILKLTEALGYPYEEGETHREFADRVPFGFYYFDNKGIKEITEIFIRNKYGNSPVLEDEVLEMIAFRNILKTRIRYNLGVFGYLKMYLKL